MLGCGWKLCWVTVRCAYICHQIQKQLRTWTWFSFISTVCFAIVEFYCCVSPRKGTKNVLGSRRWVAVPRLLLKPGFGGRREFLSNVCSLFSPRSLSGTRLCTWLPCGSAVCILGGRLIGFGLCLVPGRARGVRVGSSTSLC